MKKIEEHNTLVFLTHLRANKAQIKMAVKKLYNVDVAKINTLVRYYYLLLLIIKNKIEIIMNKIV
jgi:ribosomal protein L23